MSLEYGVRIDEILEGSAAQDAGLLVGDVVTAVNGRPAYSPERMRYLVEQSADAATLSLMRGDKLLELSAAFAKPEAAEATVNRIAGRDLEPAGLIRITAPDDLAEYRV